MTFGFHATVCFAIFLLIYVIMLVGLFPLLEQESPNHIPQHRGEVLSPVVHHAVDTLKKMPHVPGQRLAEGLAENVVGGIKKKIQNLRKSEGVTDASLIQQAAEEIEVMRKRRHAANAVGGNAAAISAAAPQAKPAPGRRPGFMVLGMHRSGTSVCLVCRGVSPILYRKLYIF